MSRDESVGALLACSSGIRRYGTRARVVRQVRRRLFLFLALNLLSAIAIGISAYHRAYVWNTLHWLEMGSGGMEVIRPLPEEYAFALLRKRQLQGQQNAQNPDEG